MEIGNPKESPLVPEDIIEEILSRLPVKSLLRFKCVSKAWGSLIRSKRFVKTHLRNSTKSTVIIEGRKGIKQCSLQSLLDTSISPPPVDDPIINQLIDPIILGCRNGLVWILDEHGDEDFFLWNPSTKILKKLPQVDEINENFMVFNHGVGQDESSDDYKVFAFFWMLKSDEYIGKVYSSKTYSWKTIEHMRFASKNCLSNDPKVDLVCFPLKREEGVFVGGKLHWKKFGCEEPIACFDLKSELWGKIELPFKAEPCFSRRCSMVGAIGGCLSFVRFYEGSSTAEVWVMKEYGVKESWSKLVALSHVQELVRRPFSAPFVVGQDGEVLLSFGRFFLAYCPKDNVFRAVTEVANKEFVCVESLVSP